MTIIGIQSNNFFGSSLAITQEDEHHGVINRFDLYHDVAKLQFFGRLICYNNGTYSVLQYVDTYYIRFNFTDENEIKIS